MNPAWTSAAYSVAPTPQVSALLPPPMHVWLSVAWMKSPGSSIRSRATWWQMPGLTPFVAANESTFVCFWNAFCMSRRVWILPMKGRIRWTSSA